MISRASNRLRTRSELALVVALLATGCGHDDPATGDLYTKRPEPIVVLNVHLDCQGCVMDQAEYEAWLASLTATCQADFVTIEGGTTMPALALPPEYELGSTRGGDSSAWNDVAGFVARARFDHVGGGTVSLGSELGHIGVATVRDCRTFREYVLKAVHLDETPDAQEAGLEMLGEEIPESQQALLMTGGFHITSAQALYARLLHPPGARIDLLNAGDMAIEFDTSAAPGLEISEIADHVFLGADRSWRVPRWELLSRNFGGKRMTDHPPICTVVQEMDVGTENVFSRGLCK